MSFTPPDYPIEWINNKTEDHYFTTSWEFIEIRRTSDRGCSFRYKNNFQGNIKAAAKMRALNKSGIQIRSGLFCLSPAITQERIRNHGTSDFRQESICSEAR